MTLSEALKEQMKDDFKFCPRCGIEIDNENNETTLCKNYSNHRKFSILEKINMEIVQKEFYTSKNWERLYSLILPLFRNNPYDEEILYYSLNILIKYNLVGAKQLISLLDENCFEVLCAKIEINFMDDNLSEVEKILNEAEELYPDNKILNCKRIRFLLKVGCTLENEDCISIASELFKSMDNPVSKREYKETENILYIISNNKIYNNSKVIDTLRKIAEHGNIPVQNSLGDMYYFGDGVELDYEKARKWYLKAAEQGYDEAQYNLGYMYANGLGVELDYDEAYKWYLKAAEQGNSRAQSSLGGMYFNGHGFEVNYEEAIKWYLKASNQGYAKAQIYLGEMYEYGQGVESDYEEAHKWYLKAANQEDVWGQFHLGYMYENGLGVELDYEEAYKWYLKAANQGHATSQCNLGLLYLHGDGVELDYQKAYDWIFKAASQGHAVAQNNLGSIYHNGTGVKVNFKEAIKWYMKAANQGSDTAMNNLAIVKFKIGKRLFNYYCSIIDD